MTEQDDRTTKDQPDPAEVVKTLVEMAAQSQRLFADFLNDQAEAAARGEQPAVDPLNIAPALKQAALGVFANPAKMMQAQAELWQDYVRLWEHTMTRAAGAESKPVVEPAPGDRRFSDPEWAGNQIFDFIKQSYLLTARWMQRAVQDLDGVDEKTKQKIDFYTRQFADAVAPTNFVMTNPQVLRATVDSGGQNLVRGLQAMLDDAERTGGVPQPRMTDVTAFKLGENIALAPGKVIAQTELMQLIQYEPVTEQVYRQPLLIVPPWINKYYILDLRPENSFVKWATEQGYTVFVVSWVNPDTRLAAKSFEDYAFEGILAALTAVEQATGERQVSAIGYCIGGTLMASTLAYMAAQGDDRIAACTFLAAQVDFSEAGELAVFIDEEQIQYLERRMEQEGGVLEGSAMATTFNLLRSNDLIWSYVVNNYLLGKEPAPFDLLFWNSDTTRMPAAMHSYYLRNMYQRNLLVQPGALAFKGTPLDLTKIGIPIYLQAAREDHIAPFKSVFKATTYYRGPVRVMLAGSGHIAGVVNPPARNKYQYWTNETDKRYATSDEWLADAVEHPGSWWPDWNAWLAPLSGPMVPARQPGDGALEPIEEAPGSYVRVKA